MIITTFINISLFNYGQMHTFTLSAIASWFICWWLLLFFLTVKNWMIYFKYKWTYFTLQLEWQQILNSKIVTQIEQENWYIRNNNKYGNLSFVYKLFGIIYFAALSISFAALILMPKIQLIAVGMLVSTVMPAIIFYGALVCKTPFIDDTFYIHWESKMHSRVLMMMDLSALHLMPFQY